MFDAQEYLHLAIHASNKNDIHAAMQYLKEALVQAPDLAPAHYLLAAQYAEIGLFDRAISGMEKALELDNGIEMAKFQLAQLYLRNNTNVEKAKIRLEELSSTGVDESLKIFARGLLALINEDREQAKNCLAQGILVSDHNAALKADMQALLNNLLSTQSTEAQLPTNELPATGAYLGAYQQHSANDA